MYLHGVKKHGLLQTVTENLGPISVRDTGKYSSLFLADEYDSYQIRSDQGTLLCTVTRKNGFDYDVALPKPQTIRLGVSSSGMVLS
jgi:hypothetical protein